MCTDHGHNFMRSTNVLFDDVLKQAGFHLTNSVRGPRDVVIDVDGLVTYLGLHTQKPAEVADAVLKRNEVEIVTYLQQDHVIMRDHDGTAQIDYRNGRFKYTPTSGDVLQYKDIVERLRPMARLMQMDSSLTQTGSARRLNAEFPDGPRRLWDAFHGQCVSPPDVMLTLRDGFCSGHTTFQKFITMASTHGGLNQINSATFFSP